MFSTKRIKVMKDFGPRGIDSNGFILPAPNGPIQGEFEGLIQDACNTLVAQASNGLDSIYLYGSIASGIAKPGTSDLDLCIVLRHEDENLRASIESARVLLEKRHPEVTKVDFDIGLHNEVLAPENLFSWGYWLKHHCLNLWGTDLAENFQRFKPSRDIAIAVNGDFSEVLEQYIARINTEGKFSNVRHLQREAARKLIRSTNIFRTELDTDWPHTLEMHVALFLRTFPTMESQTNFFLTEAKNPTATPFMFTTRIEEFVSWMKLERLKTERD